MIKPHYQRMASALAIAAILISAAMAGGTYYIEIERVDQTFSDLAAGEARAFQTLHSELFTPGFKEEQVVVASLQQFMAARRINLDGHFIIAELYDPARHSLGETFQDEGIAVDQQISGNHHEFPDDATPWYDKLTINGQLLIQVVVPLFDTESRPIGFFEGVYHVSETRLATIRQRLFSTVLLVIGVVFSTTLFLVPVIIGVNRALMALSQRLLRANLETLEVLGNAIAMRDSDTGTHLYRVTIFSIRLAEAVGVPRQQLCDLVKGAFLHDVGKIAIADAILLKPGRLTPEEFAIMQQHVAHGLDIVSQATWLSEAADVVLHHHEKFNGSGYLKGLSGTDIPLSARIFAIADVFDALISRRPYKEPMSLEQALTIIEDGAGSHFDPRLVAIFRGIAPGLYASVVGKDDAEIEHQLIVLTDHLFGVAKA